MKITVGDITIEVEDGESVSQAVSVIRELNGSAKAIKQSEARKESMREAAKKIDTGTGELNAIQYRTWQYLVDNDCPSGIHVSQLAHAFGIDGGAANTRCITLLKLGYVERVARGYYKAVTP